MESNIFFTPKYHWLNSFLFVVDIFCHKSRVVWWSLLSSLDSLSCLSKSRAEVADAKLGNARTREKFHSSCCWQPKSSQLLLLCEDKLSTCIFYSINWTNQPPIISCHLLKLRKLSLCAYNQMHLTNICPQSEEYK